MSLRSRAGFSLVELLTVIALMSIMTGIGFSLLKPRTGNPADAAQLVAAACNAAQADAIASGAPARVILCIDPNAGNKYLRYVGILVQDAALTTSTTTYWKSSAKGNTLPQGTLFVASSNYSNASDTMLYDLSNSNSQNGTSGLTFTYIEFDPTGQVANGSNSVQWVFEHGMVNAATAALMAENKKDLDGFIVRRLGKFVYFASPDQISAPTL